MERAVMNSLLEWREKKNRKPLIIQGARQVGKTHLLKEFGKRHFEKYHYINFENKSVLSEVFEKTLDPASIISEIEFHLETKIDKDKDIIIFDEIQREPRALTSLKYFCEEMPEIAVCAAGSLLGVTMNIDSFPVGKVDMLELRP
ncbi:MAG TPA: AAA family ATPase, partial [bacterium]|nr:AAA family ATPase [bacterium]